MNIFKISIPQSTLYFTEQEIRELAEGIAGDCFRDRIGPSAQIWSYSVDNLLAYPAALNTRSNLRIAVPFNVMGQGVIQILCLYLYSADQYDAEDVVAYIEDQIALAPHSPKDLQQLLRPTVLLTDNLFKN